MRARAVYLGLFATTLGFTLAAATRQFAPASSIGVSAKEIGSARNIAHAGKPAGAALIAIILQRRQRISMEIC
jgi:hypothetical protein